MNESDEIEKLRQKVIKGEAKDKDLIIQSCRYSMVNPTCPTDEELKDISRTGFEVLTEIYMSIPMIGMTDKEKEDFIIYKKHIKTISAGYNPELHMEIAKFCNKFENDVIIPKLNNEDKKIFRNAK